MKKMSCVVFALLLIPLLSIQIFAASVTPQRFEGNDENSYIPPEGCFRYTVPGSGSSGTYTLKFDDEGNIDPNGSNVFTVVVGTKSGDSFTSVLSWSSNFPIYAVIVKGGDAFNLY